MISKIIYALIFLFKKYIYFQKYFTVGVVNLNSICPDKDFTGNFEIEEIDCKDNLGLIMPDEKLVRKYYYRCKRNMKCFVCKVNDKIAGISWISFSRKFNEGVKINMSSKDALLLESFTFPEFRNRGIQKALIQTRLLWLKCNNFERVFVIYEPDNIYSEKALMRNDFAVYKRLKVFRIIGFYFQKNAEL
ncbi:MAG: GNAT family N-acetyltransferase [Ignavibacteria bacterium]|nr:GNAT family N-acetyltransferase [Ignavibacteria bacterium]